MANKHKYVPGVNNYRSIYVPLNLYDLLKRISSVRKEKMCDTIKTAINYMEEIDSDKSFNFKLIKNVLEDYSKAFSNLSDEIRDLKNKTQSMTAAYVELIHKLNNH